MSKVTDNDPISSTEAAEAAPEELKQVVDETKEVVDAPVVPVSNKSLFLVLQIIMAASSSYLPNIRNQSYHQKPKLPQLKPYQNQPNRFPVKYRHQVTQSLLLKSQ